MNYKKFHIDEETLKITSPNGHICAPQSRFSTINECLVHIDWLLKPFMKLNYNDIEVLEIIEEENGNEKERDFSNWMENEAENSLHNSTSHHYE